jgi:hypothetical protein
MGGLGAKLIAVVVLGWSAPAWGQDATGDSPDITGTFHLRMRSETHAKVPVLGTAVISTITDVVATVQRENDQWVQRHSTCTVKTVTTRAIAKTILPDRFVRALGDKRYPVELRHDNAGWHYTAHFTPQHIGYDAAMSDGVMPTDKHDPSIVDWDNDGKPGATVLLRIPIFGDIGIYMVQYNHSVLNGRIESADRVTGTMAMLGMNQRTIGADNRLFIANPSIVPAPEAQPFEMDRIPDGSTCADLRQRALTSDG